MLHYTISSRFSLFCYLCVALFYATTASSSVSYVIILYLQCFHCFIICLLRHCTVRGFDCLVFCLLHHHAFSSRFLIIHYLFGYVIAVFWVSTVSSSVLLRRCAFLSRLPLFHYLFVTSVLYPRLRLSLLLFVTSLCFLLVVSIVSLLYVCYVSLLSLRGFNCFIICLLRHYFVLDFACLFFCLLRHYAFSSWFLLFHYMFVTSVYYLFKVSIVSLSVYYVTALF